MIYIDKSRYFLYLEICYLEIPRNIYIFKSIMLRNLDLLSISKYVMWRNLDISTVSNQHNISPNVCDPLDVTEFVLSFTASRL